MSSLVYALWVDPYPYRDSSRLLNLSFVDQQGRNGTMWYSLADYMELQHASVKCSDPINTTNFIQVRVTSGTLEGHVGRVCEDDVFRTVVWP